MNIYISKVEYEIFGHICEIPSIKAFPGIVDDNDFIKFISEYNPTFKIGNCFYVYIEVDCCKIDSYMKLYDWEKTNDVNLYSKKIGPSVNETISNATDRASNNTNVSSTDDENKIIIKIYPECEEIER